MPIDLAINTIKNHWNELQDFTSLPQEEFIKALELTLNTTYFQYNNSFYKQIFGCAMGSPISSSIAQLVLEDLEKNILSQLDFTPIFYKRYVDDCIVCLPIDKIEYILNKFNSYHPKLQFTIEKEEQNKINFLDLTLIRKNNKIFTKLYQKATSSGRYLNYNSNQSVSIKKSVVVSLMDRAIKLTSAEYRPEIIKQIKEILIDNDYPVNFINSIFKYRLNKFYNNNNNIKNQSINTQNPIKYIAIPYVQHLSEKINKILRPWNFKIAHKNNNNLKFLFTKLKSQDPFDKQTHVVYKIPCTECNGVYIGQTMQHLSDRLNGHKYAKNVTALKKHVVNTKHTFKFEETKILCKEKNNKTRNILEHLQIKKHINAVNDRTEIQNLAAAYHSII